MTKVLSVAVFHRAVHFLPLCTFMELHRGISRPHTQATDRPADFYFVRKIIQPCGVGRDLLESVTREEVINMVHLVWEEVNESKRGVVSYLFKKLSCVLLQSI